MANVIERRLDRISKKHRVVLKALAARHTALADLALSFPALLFALAVPRVGFEPEPVIKQVINGCGLNELAKLAQLPRWLRKLLPESFIKPIGILPDGELFVRQIGNFVPRSPKLAVNWLESVSLAADWSHDAFAVWIARVVAKERRAFKTERLRKLALWSWYSTAKDTLGHRLIETPWTPRVGLEQAIHASNKWLDTASLHVSVGGNPLMDMWCQPSTVDGYDFVALRTTGEIAEEAITMRNCLRAFGEDILYNRSRIWSVRKDGARIACLSLGRSHGDRLTAITQLQARNNGEAPRDVALAARKWLNSHDLSVINPDRRPWNTVPPDRQAWTDLWRPYWIAKRRLPDWLPLSPSRAALNRLLWS